MNKAFTDLSVAIAADPMNAHHTAQGYTPVYTAGAKARLLIIGQAPGIKAQISKKPWNDASGELLRKWIGISEEEFYDPQTVALVPVDFYYPGKGEHGDLPPRKDFATKWHPPLLKLMPDIRLTLLVGSYAQRHYLGTTRRKSLTETVRNYRDYLPQYFPIVHPSPLTFRWRAKNPWFEAEVVPELRMLVDATLKRG